MVLLGRLTYLRPLIRLLETIQLFCVCKFIDRFVYTWNNCLQNTLGSSQGVSYIHFLSKIFFMIKQTKAIVSSRVRSPSPFSEDPPPPHFWVPPLSEAN